VQNVSSAFRFSFLGSVAGQKPGASPDHTKYIACISIFVNHLWTPFGLTPIGRAVTRRGAPARSIANSADPQTCRAFDPDAPTEPNLTSVTVLPFLEMAP
jgi:hypothetical protein